MKEYPRILMRFENYIFLSALFVYIVSAWFSEGFYHSDEHYTIIEYAQYKMGNVSPEELTWEFDVRIKPALLALVAFLFIKAFGFLTITDPYTQAFIMRFLTALLAVFSIRFFIRRSKRMVLPELQTAYLFLSYLLWFLPLLNVRFLSESLSGIILLNTLAVLLNPDIRNRDYFIAGGLLGIGFLIRYPHAVLALGIFLWLLIIRRENLANLLRLLSAGGAVLLLGMLPDWWLYGEFVLTPWNYFSANILGDVASGFGTEAWWNYFYSIFRFCFFPIGLPILFSFILLTIKKPRNIFIWTILPFFVVHSILPHKELRYLFPLANLVPILLILAYQEIKPAVAGWRKPGRIALRCTLWILFAINCIGVFTVSLKPSDGGLMRITHYIRLKYGEQPVRLISYNQSNPYGPLGVMTTFYMEKDMQDFRLQSLNELGDSTLDFNRVNLLVLKRKDAASDPARDFFTTHRVTKEVQCIPEWMEPLMVIYGGFRIRDIRELYEIHTKYSTEPGQQ